MSPDEGNPEKPYEFQLLKWQEMKEGLVIPGIPVKQEVPEWDGRYLLGQNPTFKRFGTRTMRPVVDFETCTKCTNCWSQCPDSCFDVTPTGHYDTNMEACCRCAVCEAVCPVKDCITMVNEKAFEGNGSQFETYEKDPAVYKACATEKITYKTITARPHGFRYRGQYEDELTEAARVKTRARKGAAREGRDRWKSSRAGWRERGCGSRWSR